MRKVVVKAKCPKCGEEVAVEVDPGKLLVSLRKKPGRNGGRPKGAKDTKPRTRRTKKELGK